MEDIKCGEPLYSVRLFDRNDQVATEVGTSVVRSLVSTEQGNPALVEPGQAASLVLLAVDTMQSILAGQAGSQAVKLEYPPYGYTAPHSLVATAFNGQPQDRGTGCYLLGSGYRAYNPVLMRFNSPDSWSPFGAGGWNGYAYVSCDPVNHFDPSGHVKQLRGVVGKPAQRPNSFLKPLPGSSTANTPTISRSNSSASSSKASSSPSTPSSSSSNASPRSSRYDSQSSLSSSSSMANDRDWVLNKAEAEFKKSGLSEAEQRSFDTFQNAIHNFGLSPKNAASLVGGADYKQLDKKTSLYQIRLSKSERVTFTLEGKLATIRQVGGHT